MNKLKSLLLVLPFTAIVATAQEVRDYDLESPSSEEMDAVMKNTDDPADDATNWLWSEYLQEDPNCQQLDTDPNFDDDVYIERLRSLSMVVELPYNKIVRSYIDRYTKRSRTQVRRLLGAMNFYTPIFERELDKHGVPLELKYLPVIESALKPEATSPVGAAGLWQFMASTGKQYNLRINSRVDERRDIVKSSEAAARLLSDLFKKYNDWALVLAAYNCGPGNVNKAMSRAGGKRDFWAIYNYLPKETRGYVPAFIAATYVMNFYCEHGICPLEAKYPPIVDTVHVSRDLNMRQVSELLGVGMSELKALNPQYKTDIIPGYAGNCVLVLPEQFTAQFASYGNDIYKYRANELLQRRATVEVGGGRGDYNVSDDNNRNLTASTEPTTEPRTSENKSRISENSGRRTRSSFRNHRNDGEERAEARTVAPANNPRQDNTRQEASVSEAGVRTISSSIREDRNNVSFSESQDEYRNSSALDDDASIKPVETNTTRRNSNTNANPNRGYTSSSSYESRSNNRRNYSNNSSNNTRSNTNRTSHNVAPTSEAKNSNTTTTETGARIRKDRTSSATTTPKKEEKTATTSRPSTKSVAPKPAEQPRNANATKPSTTNSSKRESETSRTSNYNSRGSNYNRRGYSSSRSETNTRTKESTSKTADKHESNKTHSSATTNKTNTKTSSNKPAASETHKGVTTNKTNTKTLTNKPAANETRKAETTNKTNTKTTSNKTATTATQKNAVNNKTNTKTTLNKPAANETRKAETTNKTNTKTTSNKTAATATQKNAATNKTNNTKTTSNKPATTATQKAATTTKQANTTKQTTTTTKQTTTKPATPAKPSTVAPAKKSTGTNVGKSSGKSGSSK